jgi:hypothetical protein
MVPALRVLVAVALDTDLLVDDHELDMATAFLLGLDDGLGLVLGDVPKVVQTGTGCRRQGFVELVGHNFVVAALMREEFALWK